MNIIIFDTLRDNTEETSGVEFTWQAISLGAEKSKS